MHFSARAEGFSSAGAWSCATATARVAGPRRRAERPRRAASHRQPAGPALRRRLVRARRDHPDDLRPDGASPRPRRRGRDVPPQRRVLPTATAVHRPFMRPEQAPRGPAPPPRAGGSLRPPAHPADDTASGSLERRAETTSAPAALLAVVHQQAAANVAEPELQGLVGSIRASCQRPRQIDAQLLTNSRTAIDSDLVSSQKSIVRDAFLRALEVRLEAMRGSAG